MFNFFKKNKKASRNQVDKYDKHGKEKVQLESALADIENGNIKGGMDSLIKLAIQGYPEAEYYLGDINEFKIHNYKEAAKWYLFAAEHGQPNAQRNIADLYIAGKGVEVNNKEAIKWYIKAAEQGIPEAQFVLGEQYRSGVFVNKDTDSARKYYTLSAKNGYEPAKIRLEQLKSKDVNRKSKDNLEQTPAQFTTELLKDFVDVATKEGYLHGTSPIVPEIMQWGAHSFLRAIKNTDKISLTDINLHYMYVGMLNFIYASCITETWNKNFSLFKKTDYKVNGLEEDFEQALKKMLLTFSKINGEVPTTQEFNNFFIKLSEIFNKKMIPYFNVSDRIQKDFIFAGMSSYFTLGMAIKLKSIDKGALENIKCEDESTFHFDNGDKYVGQWKNGLMEGNGTYYYNDGNKYEGHFRNDKREGTGIYYYADGRKQEGVWLDDKMEGMGAFYSTNGSRRYVGQYKNGLKEGNGTYYFFSGDRQERDKYVGQFRDGGMEGEGTLYFASGDKYVGQFKICAQNGIGTYYFNNGDKYEGQFKNNRRSGNGTLYFGSGDKYVGQWKNNLKEDYGTYYYDNGDKYVGQFKNDKEEGVGTLYNSDGSVTYDGEWSDGGMDGMGTYFFDDGDKYVGQLENSKREGIGTLYNSDGSITYEGEWSEDDIDGMGTLFSSDGDKYVGQFKNDKREGTGTLYNSDGTIIYEGEWSEDDMDGMGTLSPPRDEYVGQGSIFDGEWCNNEEDVDNDLLANSILPDLLASEMGGNSDEIPNSSGKFGYEIYNPIPVAGIESNKVYLSRLITDKNERITWDRVGSYNLKGMQGCIDEYNIYLESTKQNLCTLFIDPYNKKTSNKAPEGFRIVSKV